jgi:hypothetical protein
VCGGDRKIEIGKVVAGSILLQEEVQKGGEDANFGMPLSKYGKN